MTIVTPNYNLDRYLEETIRSILLQGYPNLEYFVMDGGSTDGSVEIIRRYAQWLTYWESAKDRGQSHAINKGFARASGELWAWMNSSDLYLPGALQIFALLHARRPDAVVYMGASELMFLDGRIGLQVPKAETFLDYVDPERVSRNSPAYQPAHMWSGERALEVGPLDETNHLTMDTDFIMKLLEFDRKAACTSSVVTRVHFHEGQKSDDGIASAEAIAAMQRRYFERIKHLLPVDEQKRIDYNLRTALAQIELHRFSGSGWKDVGALVRSFTANPHVVIEKTLVKLKGI